MRKFYSRPFVFNLVSLANKGNKSLKTNRFNYKVKSYFFKDTLSNKNIYIKPLAENIALLNHALY